MASTEVIKKCVVCDDKASGYNFNVLTCGSCKAFFRRNALKDENHFKCPFEGKCDLNLITRKFCQKCRLNKCLEVGMKKDLILSERELELRSKRRAEKLMKLKLNSQKKTTTDDKSTTDSGNSSVDCDFMTQIFLDNSISDEKIKAQIIDIEKSVDTTKNTIVWTHKPSISKVSEFPIIPIVRPITDYNNNFNAMESNRLTELLSASHILKMPYGSVKSVANTYLDAMEAIAEHMEQVIDKLVSMSKRLTLFNAVCVSDQIALIKYGSIEMVYLRQIIGYNADTNHLVVPDEDPTQSVVIYLDAINQEKQYLYKAHVKYFQEFVREWDCDETIVDLLTAIILFDPNRPSLQHRMLVK
ncbi:unnamed protein product [Oppiella nova]|uniref:Nuclear hormone receptor HR96 n=1 Tax=Oppiella nova TaxID=334625 RepID=A0A7R9M1Z1_9ACAR|nr:unnamed protein product [Oppiella nova]CAG2169271.1 unnamed protein product [Oppiella nova]